MIARSPWWQPHIHADRRPFLAARGQITAALRRFFEARDFVEVETPALQVSPGNETHLHAFATDLISPGAEAARLHLHTSPEFTCKKLLAAGEEKIFTLARVFRNRERGPLHHPEFTMVEWYRAHEPYEALMADVAALMETVARQVGVEAFGYRGRTIDPRLAPERLSVREAFLRFTGIDLDESTGQTTENTDQSTSNTGPSTGNTGLGTDKTERLRVSAEAIGVRTAQDDGWTDIFSRIMAERIEPNLGIGRATILDEYPASEAALARRKPGDPRVCERFELYACGVELANAFGELTDVAEQRSRFEADMAEKQRIYGESYPIDVDFLHALDSMPPASGIALGLDRLVMLATGASHIEQVLWAPVPDPFAQEARR